METLPRFWKSFRLFFGDIGIGHEKRVSRTFREKLSRLPWWGLVICSGDINRLIGAATSGVDPLSRAGFKTHVLRWIIDDFKSSGIDKKLNSMLAMGLSNSSCLTNQAIALKPRRRFSSRESACTSETMGLDGAVHQQKACIISSCSLSFNILCSTTIPTGAINSQKES